MSTSGNPTEVDVGDLYRGPLHAFTQARNSLAKRLKAHGRTDDAARVAALRKPSTVLWALNQLGLHAPDDLAALFAVGARLRTAQTRLLSGDRDAARELRAASAEQRRLADLLSRRAVMVLTASEHAADQNARRQIGMALIALATAPPELHDELMAGRLSSEPPPSGFPVTEDDPAKVLAVDTSVAPSGPRRPRRTAAAGGAEGGGLRERPTDPQRLAAARLAVETAGRALGAVQRELMSARREAERLQRRAAAVAADAAAAAGAAEQAAVTAAQLEERRAGAARTLEEAQAELSTVEDRPG